MSRTTRGDGDDSEVETQKVTSKAPSERRNRTPSFRTRSDKETREWLRVLVLLRGECDAVDMSDTEDVFKDFVMSFSSLLLYPKETIVVQNMKCQGSNLTVNLTVNTTQHPNCEADLATLIAHRNLRVNLHGTSFYIETYQTDISHIFETKPGRKHDRVKYLYMALGGVGVSLACVALAGVVFAGYQHCAVRRAKLVFADDGNVYIPGSSYRGHVRHKETDHRVRFADAHSFTVNMYRSYSDLSSPEIFQAPKEPSEAKRTRRAREEVWEESISRTSQEYTSVSGLSSFRPDEQVLHPLLLNGRANAGVETTGKGATGGKKGSASVGRKTDGKTGAGKIEEGKVVKNRHSGTPVNTGDRFGTRGTGDNKDPGTGVTTGEESKKVPKKPKGKGKTTAPGPPPHLSPPSPQVARDVLERMGHLDEILAHALSTSSPDVNTHAHATVSVSELYTFTAAPSSTTTSTTSLFTHAPSPRPQARTQGQTGRVQESSAAPLNAPPPSSNSTESLCLTRITFMGMENPSFRMETDM